MAHLYEQVLSIVTKPPEERQEKEIQRIVYWFRKKSELFKDLKEEIILDILKNCQFTPCNRDDIIIRQGEKGDCFYIILTGSVAIYINTNLYDEDPEDDVRVRVREKKPSFSAMKPLNIGKGLSVQNLDRTKYGNYIGRIAAGKSFGELALIRTDSVRNATIIANELTHLLVVNRDLYNRSLLTYQAHEYEKKKTFVDNYPLFQHWQPKYKKMMAMSLVKSNLKFEDVIIKQTNPVEGLYFVISGQVKVVIDASLHSEQYPDLYPKSNVADLEKEKARDILRKEMSLQSLKTVDKKSTFQRKLPQHESKKENQRYIELCLLGAVEIIGDLELMLGLPTYAETIICTQEAEIFFLGLKNYDRLIEKRNPLTIDIMRNILHTKLTLHFQRLSEDKLPLFRFFLYTLDEKERTNKMRDSHQSSSCSKSGTCYTSIDSLRRGPLVNLFGPGSVFYIIRMREKERKRRAAMRHQDRRGVGGGGGGPSTAATAVAAATAGVGAGAAGAGVKDGGSPSHLLNQGKRNLFDDMARGLIPSIDIDTSILDTFQNQREFATASMTSRSAPAESAAPNSAEYEYGHSERMDSVKLAEERGRCEWCDELQLTVGDQALSELEDRIQAWYNSFGDSVARVERTVNKPVKLHRFQVEDESLKPKPGNKVYVRGRYRAKSVGVDSSRDLLASSVKFSKSHCGTTRSDMSAGMYNDFSNHPSDEEQEPEIKSRQSRSECSRRSQFPISFKKNDQKRQYTLEEYLALKEELRRRQRAYKSFLPMKTSTF
ncbi:uncharacterized protein LOC121381874 isoform X2 [Gigantopelta aegis]|uniref:uncharacterized protein LOC121381874 isoform X2 n=1 Tax=Gigantopelta aegis TaxID=1735272 RepID=UPI001B88BDAE|nr:uncharacterized protein LOC121381874 isoform X2 [Gigantopelta aegis]